MISAVRGEKKGGGARMRTLLMEKCDMCRECLGNNIGGEFEVVVFFF